MRKIFAFITGSLFGLGLLISGMTDPQKVQSFLNPFGDWDPALAIVMAGGLSVSAIGWFIAGKRNVALFGGALPSAPRPVVDRDLVFGAGMFGIGWGLVGICPGAGIATMAFGGWEILVFLAAMIAGMVLFSRFQDRRILRTQAA